MGDRLGHSPPADGFHMELCIAGRLAHRQSPVAVVVFRYGVLLERANAEWHKRGPCAAMLQRYGPESRGGEFGLQDHSSSGPKRREHRVDLSVRVKERQVNEVHVLGAQVLVCGAHLSAPQSVGMGP